MPPRPPLPPGLAPRPLERALEPRALERAPELRPLEAAAMAPPPIVPEPEPADAALASMAQRLEAALRRPGAPEGRQGADLTQGSAAADLAEQNGAKPKSVLDSLEEEMASLL